MESDFLVCPRVRVGIWHWCGGPIVLDLLIWLCTCRPGPAMCYLLGRLQRTVPGGQPKPRTLSWWLPLPAAILLIVRPRRKGRCGRAGVQATSQVAALNLALGSISCVRYVGEKKRTALMLWSLAQKLRLWDRIWERSGICYLKMNLSYQGRDHS